MFTADDILQRLKETPFVPVRIVTSSGQSYDVKHPDMVLVSKRWIIVGTASNERPGLIEDATRVSILHITDLQDMHHGSPPASNGPPA